MPASDKHKDYDKYIDQWQMVRDCVEGELAVKARSSAGSGESKHNWPNGGLYSLAGTKYLPPPNPEDNSNENRERYWSYRKRASFVNFTGMTKEGLMGMVFRRGIEVELPAGLEYLNDNADGGGTSFAQLVKDGIADSMETGRFFILADYPEAPMGLTAAEVDAMGLAARMCCYPAESVTNWRWERVGSEWKLTLVVLEEKHCKDVDEFTQDEKTYHRALMLKDGVYIQALYDENDNLVAHEDENGDEQPFMVPRKFDGSTWDYIPGQFFGSQNNDPTPDKSILADIAGVNLAHYRNSADYEESCFVVGQPTAVIAGLSQGWIDDNFKDGLMVGSRRAILLPEGGSGTFLQANPNQMPSEGMAKKEEQMVKLGARVIQDNGGVETAEAARIRFAGQNSKLGTLITNWEEGLENVVYWLGLFMGVDGEVEIEINKQFYEASLDPQAVIAQIQLLDRGVIGQSDVRNKLRKSGWIDHERTDEEIDEENGMADPLM